jgi:prepilin-type N-terminal cleavage/methylation domain-containing protein
MRRGFTLIELLVVIAIVSVLAAILFPVFAKAREQARATTCLTQHRHLAMATLAWAQDHDELLPPASGWVSALELTRPAVDCPSSRHRGSYAAPDYAFNQSVAERALGEIPFPTEMLLLADATPVSAGILADSGHDLDLRHQGRALGSYVDGHAGRADETPGLMKLWLRAESGLVTDANGAITGWQDQSGCANDAVAPPGHALRLATAAAGFSCVVFDGATGYLTLQGRYLFAAGTGITFCAVVASQGTNVDPFLLDFGSFGVAHYGFQYDQGQAAILTGTAHGGWQTTAGHTAGAAWVIFTGVIRFGQYQCVRLNGREVARASIRVPRLSAGQIEAASLQGMGKGPVTLGRTARIAQEWWGFQGMLAELLWFDGAGSSRACHTIEAYLAQRYGIALN